jgi:hypothetical protein
MIMITIDDPVVQAVESNWEKLREVSEGISNGESFSLCRCAVHNSAVIAEDFWYMHFWKPFRKK